MLLHIPRCFHSLHLLLTSTSQSLVHQYSMLHFHSTASHCFPSTHMRIRVHFIPTCCLPLLTAPTSHCCPFSLILSHARLSFTLPLRPYLHAALDCSLAVPLHSALIPHSLSTLRLPCAHPTFPSSYDIPVSPSLIAASLSPTAHLHIRV